LRNRRWPSGLSQVAPSRRTQILLTESSRRSAAILVSGGLMLVTSRAKAVLCARSATWTTPTSGLITGTTQGFRRSAHRANQPMVTLGEQSRFEDEIHISIRSTPTAFFAEQSVLTREDSSFAGVVYGGFVFLCYWHWLCTRLIQRAVKTCTPRMCPPKQDLAARTFVARAAPVNLG
jgi:hypothetical protein